MREKRKAELEALRTGQLGKRDEVVCAWGTGWGECAPYRLFMCLVPLRWEPTDSGTRGAVLAPCPQETREWYEPLEELAMAGYTWDFIYFMSECTRQEENGR